MLIDTLRSLTRLYMARHRLTQSQMGERIGVKQPSVMTWAFTEEQSMLNPDALERLVALLTEDGLLTNFVNAGAVRRCMAKVKTSENGTIKRETGRGAPLAVTHAMLTEDPVLTAITDRSE